MAFQVIHLENLTELKTRVGSITAQTMATIMGIDFPNEESFAVYRWYNLSTETPDNYEVVQPTPRAGQAGRWVRVDLDITPHQHPMADIIGLMSALEVKIENEVDPTVSEYIKQISETNISNWNSAFGWGNHLGLYRPISYTPAITDVVGLQTVLNNKISIGDSIPYSTLTGTPVFNNSFIVSSLGYTPYNSTNPSGFITSSGAPVQSVNTKTGLVVLSKADVGLSNVDNTSDLSKPISTATQSALNTKLSSTNIPFSKVKYYTVTSDSSSNWNLNISGDFSSILDVQATAVSTSNTISGIRQCSLNSWTSNSTNLSGVTFGSNTVPVILIAAVQALSLLPNTTVRVTVYGN